MISISSHKRVVTPIDGRRSTIMEYDVIARTLHNHQLWRLFVYTCSCWLRRQGRDSQSADACNFWTRQNYLLGGCNSILAPESSEMAKLMEQLCRQHKLLSMATSSPWNVSHVGGTKAYVLLGSLAKLERAIAKWTINELTSKHNFRPVVVPNLIHNHIIESCGFPTDSTRSQVYKIANDSEKSILDDVASGRTRDSQPQTCIAGTSEFALASIHIGDVIPADELPKRYCALSRCYRAETSESGAEWGLYRVHYFNKVEMFALTMPDDSPRMHQELLDIQQDLFKQLELEFRILDMPDDDLGLSAKRKFDIEAWMAGRKRFGEISSTSNCEDYQTSRLNIKYSRMIEKDNQLQLEEGFLHSLNGTACSTMRLLISIVEQHQTADDRIIVPKALVPYMGNVESIPCEEDKRLADLDLYPQLT